MAERENAVDRNRAFEVNKKIQKEVSGWLFGLEKPTQLISWALFSLIPYTDQLGRVKGLRQPHIMLKGPTGTGKTDLINVSAMAINAVFKRIQGSPSLKPSDILGHETIVENIDGTKTIKFVPGNIAAHLLLIDEDNRISAKAKAAILEGMEECSATFTSEFGSTRVANSKTIPLFPVSGDINDIDGRRFFMVFCTENIFGEEEGTYPNPMAQLDRITLSIYMGYPEDPKDEMKIQAGNVVGKTIEQATDLNEVLDIAHFIYRSVKSTKYADQYRVQLIRNTRPVNDPATPAEVVAKEFLRTGVSPRVHFHIEAMARTFAFFNGDNIITPDHIKAVAEPVLAHRLILKDGLEYTTSQEEVLQEIIKKTETPPCG